MTKKNIHVTHRNDNTWAVKGEGGKRASSIHKTQGAAIKAGTPIVKGNRSELVIHDRKNRLRDKDSYGNDPQRPKDKKH